MATSEARTITIPDTPSGQWITTEDGTQISAVAIRRLAKKIRTRLGRRMLRNHPKTLWTIRQASRCPNKKLIEWPVDSGNEYITYDADPADPYLDCISIADYEALVRREIGLEGVTSWVQIPATDDVKLYKIGVQVQVDTPEWELTIDDWIDERGARHQVSISMAGLLNAIEGVAPGFVALLEGYASDDQLTNAELGNLLAFWVAADPDDTTGHRAHLEAMVTNGEIT